jgi:EAL domain-containing protein (putative c-di-GMP-specific phosphodiesterase class I)
MERAKQAGRDGYRFFTAGMNVQVLARLDMELALRRALDDDELLLHYQPKVNLHTGAISGVEALLRWRRPGFGMVYPAEFVPVLEDTGLIVRVGAWIIDAACKQIGDWLHNGVGAVRVAVNVASRQFVEGDLEEVVRSALTRHHVPAELLELELTETALMSNAERTITVLSNLKQLGIKVAIDDFGTGYSSLAYLQRFPIDKLKIDIAFVRDITTNPNDAAIAQAIISMAHSLKLRVIAEGVETRAQLEYLRRSRCDEIQGYFFSRPVAAAELGALVESGRALPPPPGGGGQPAQTLLIIDDDVNVLASLHRLFRRDGYQILTAASPRGAGDRLRPAHAGHERHRIPQQGQGDVSGDHPHHPVRLHRTGGCARFDQPRRHLPLLHQAVGRHPITRQHPPGLPPLLADARQRPPRRPAGRGCDRASGSEVIEAVEP